MVTQHNSASCVTSLFCRQNAGVSNKNRIFFLMAGLFLLAGMLNAQTTWDGSANNVWNNAANWSAGIPDINDAVIIPNVANDPVIPAGVSANAKSVNVNSGASLTISASGSLSINGSTGVGMTNNGTVVNYGTLALGNITALGTIGIENTGTLNNNAGATLTIDRPSVAMSALDNKSTGSVTNSGKMVIGAIAGSSVSILNEGYFNNNGCSALINSVSNSSVFGTMSGGTFTNSGTIIENSAFWSDITTNTGIIQNLSAGTFTAITNTGLITNTVGKIWSGCTSSDWNVASNWHDGVVPVSTDHVNIHDRANDPAIPNGAVVTIRSMFIFSGGSFTVGLSATFNIDDTQVSIGMDNFGTVTNSGLMTFGAGLSSGSIALTNRGLFTNNAGAEIRIDRATTAGLYNYNGTFHNFGKITIGSVAIAADHGLSNQGTFNNNTGGEIKIDRTNDFGITNTNNSTFNNNAKITVGSVSGVGTYGLLNRYNFNNNAGGEITINRSTSAGIYNTDALTSGNIVNSGKITIGNLADVGVYAIQSTETVSNSACGQLLINHPISNGGTFSNSGLFSVNTTGTHVNNALPNNGIIEYPQGNPIPGVTNNDLLISPITICDISFAPALTIGSTNSFAAASTWYWNPSLTSVAGSYNQATNTFTWATMPATGVYTLYFVVTDNANGCSRTVSIQVTAFPVTTANAGPDQTGAATCGLTTVTLAANTPISGTGSWSIVMGTSGTFGNATSPTSTFTGSVGGTYILRWTIVNGICSSTDDVTIKFNRNPTTANAGADQTGASTCGQTQVTLAANLPTVGTGVWSIVSGTGGSFANTSSPNSTFAGTAGTTYTLRWTISNSPCTASTDDVTITFNHNPTTANAGPDQTGAATCGLTTVTLAANTPTVGTGAWSIVSGTGGSFGNASSPTSSFSGTAGNTYTLRWTISNSPCAASTDNVTIKFSRNPTTANAGPDQTGAATCGLTTVALVANTPTVGTGSWSIVTGTGGSVGNPNSPISSFSGTAGSTYTLRWTISNAPCVASTDNVTITFNRNPTTANAGPDQTGAATCGLTTVTLVANAPTVGTGAWSIVSGTGGSFANASSPTSTFSGTAGSTYTLRWTISNSPCVASTDDVTITFNRNPTTANAGPDQTSAATCGLTTVTLAANLPTVGTGAWSIVSGTGGSFANASSPTSTFSGTAGNTYTLRWTISNSPCVASTDELVVMFHQNPVVSCPGNLTVNVSDPAFNLTGSSPGGGTYSGTGVNGGMFNPASAGGGNHTVTYTYTTEAGCTDFCTFTITVNTSVTCPGNSTVCISDPAFALTDGAPSGGTYSGPGVSGGMFDPSIAGAGTHTITYTNGGTCTFTITVRGVPTSANAGPDQTGAATCGLTTVTLAANTPTVGAGAWSIVSGTGGSFANAGSPTSTFSGTAGNTYTLRWTISNAPCVASFDEMTVAFNQLPTVSCPDDLTVNCSDPAFALTGGSPAGGNYSGTGVSGGMFAPAAVGSGIYTITYTYTNALGCSGFCTFMIVVNSDPSCPTTRLWGTTSRGGEYDAGTIISLNSDGSDFHSFSFSKVEGAEPRGDLLAASNGKFYGMASNGGQTNDGVIFEYDPVADNYLVVHHFSWATSGTTPYGSLVELDGKYYGMTNDGGINGDGALFEFDPSSNVLTVLRHFFSATDGETPRGSLAAMNGKLYGMNSNGGSNGDGTLFEWNPAGSMFNVLWHFDQSIDGETPFGSLIASDGKLYGMTTNGGNNDEGVVFEFNLSDGMLTVLKHFDRPTDGSFPQGSLTASGGKLYGMTLSGGIYDNGVLFELNPVGDVYTVLKNFESSTDGGFPWGSLLASGSKLYGMTTNGGNSGDGVLFEFDLAVEEFAVLKYLDGSSDGAHPYGKLLASGGKLYGMTYNGGTDDKGTLFEFNPAGNAFTVLKHFNTYPNGKNPKGSLLASGGKFYGLASEGGVSSDGTLFEFNPAGNVFTALKHFDSPGDGAHPNGKLIAWGGKFYGMAGLGGSNDAGTLFEFNPVGNVFVVLKSFEPSGDGAFPNGSLLESGGKFYGMSSSGGSNDAGTLFEFDPVGNVFMVLKHFGGSDGAKPFGSLIESGGKLYGLTAFGGSNDAGTLFEFNPAGNAFAVLKHLGGTDGARPTGSLIASGGKLYGLSSSGGSNNAGTLFEWSPAGNVFTVLRHFDNSNDGAYPNSSLLESGGKLYGMAIAGGTFNDGTLFEWNPGNNMFTVLKHFNSTDGANPQYGNLIAVDAPEINVQGNLTDIADGDNTPSATDHTDFGNTVVNGSFTRTFTIENTKAIALNINSITSSNPEFAIGAAPSSVAPMSSVTFDVSFLPTATGIQNATITLYNDDPDESVFDFSVAGAGVCAGAGWVLCPQNLVVNTGDPAFALTGASPTGGTYSGPGVDEGIFDPAAAGAGVHTITYTYTDGAGCSDACTFTITVSTGSYIQISGMLIWEHDDTSGVGNATVALTGDQSGSQTTPADGTYSFTVSSGSNFTVTPTKNINKLNGVTTADATRIQQHVANNDLITDPYKLVAADVNKTNTITTIDASIINQALLGNPSALAQFKTSWRFVPTTHTMTNPPWDFPESIALSGVQGDTPGQDFLGIKTGDVLTPYTDPSNFTNPDAPAFVLHTPDQWLESGTQVVVSFTADQFADLAAIQFALKFDVEKLAFAGMELLGGLPFSEDNFGTYRISEGEMRIVWSQAEGVFVEEAAPVFRLTFNVLETGAALSEALQLAEEVLEGHAYTSTLTDNKVKLQFTVTTSTGNPVVQPQFALLQNRPNPFTTQTTISFVLPQESAAQLRVYDAAGRVLFSQQKNYPAGQHEEVLDLEGASGVLYYELATPSGVLTRKMTAMNR